MIRTVIEVNVRRLLHNRIELLLTFAVPIVFFSIFALIFAGGVGGGATPKIKLVAVDEIDSATSRAVIASLKENAALRFVRDDDPASLSRDEASEMVRRGGLALAVVLRDDDGQIAVDLLTDAADQIAPQVVSSLLGRALAMAAIAPAAARTRPDSAAAMPGRAERINVFDVMGEGKANPVISMYAAGIAVMFLLFGAAGGGGALLEERECQTLDRLLSTRLSMDQLLLGKWFYMTGLGILQVGVMFLWAQAVFHVDLLGHLDGFLLMTVATALAASAFGLFLATVCKTRGQLNGLSVILILSMSALGGSMVPRYVMSEQLQQYGLYTFNAWALDGYDKVFWRELPVSALAPQLSVLLASSFVLMLAARVLAVRWESD
jgi:ABC-2 type transport system permease protein